jgi:hypothetical protein
MPVFLISCAHDWSWSPVANYNYSLHSNSSKRSRPQLNRSHSLTSFRLSTPDKSKTVCFLRVQNQKYPFGYFLLVPTTGVEPARPYGHIPLKDARLPIPPRGHSFCDSW